MKGCELSAAEGGGCGCVRVSLCVCVWGGGGGQALRTALQTISISLQNSFCESHTLRLVSWKALRELHDHCALSVYPIFEDEKSNGSDEKIGQVKNRIKNTNRTNIIATNFVCEQLNKADCKTCTQCNMKIRIRQIEQTILIYILQILDLNWTTRWKADLTVLIVQHFFSKTSKPEIAAMKNL